MSSLDHCRFELRPTFRRAAAVCASALLLTQAAVSPVFSQEVTTTTAQSAAESRNESRNRQIVTAAFERWAAGGSDFFNETLAVDVIWTIEGSGPSAGVYKGLEDFTARALRPFARRMSVPVRPVSQRIWAEGDHVITLWAGEGVARDGRPYRNRYVWIFRMQAGKAVEVNAFLDLPAYDDVLRRIPDTDVSGEGANTQPQREQTMSQQHPYVGMWVTLDGRIRQELLPNGRYDEARGSRKSAYQGRYEVTGNRINYWDDTGFTADGTFVNDDELHHGGMVFRREKLGRAAR